MELASNYWDEMGNGNPGQVHSALFSKAADELQVTADFVKDNKLISSCEVGNLSACLALRRSHFYKAVGYYGVTELLAADRFKHVVKAMKKVGLSADGRAYHELHVTIDRKHGAGWFKNGVKPLSLHEAARREMAMGAFMRLHVSEKNLDELCSVLDGKTMS